MSLREIIADITIENEGFTSEIRSRVNAALTQAIAQYKRIMRAWIEAEKDQRIPYASGELLESGIDVLHESAVVDTSFKAVFGFSAQHAKYVDEGRTPAFPPVHKIREWCRIVGIPEKDALRIAQHLSWHRTPGKHFFEPGVVEARRVLQEQLISAFAVQKLEATVSI